MIEYFLGYTMGQSAATRAASLARSAAVADGSRHTNRIEDIDERVDRLLMIVRAMWALMEEQGMTPEQLMAKIDELDLQDGVDDDRVRSQVVECPSCQSKVAPGLRACQLCGTEVRPDTGHPLSQV
ncbi:MAG TPA: zinc ribbon domain-containing protein [Acidimicrobiia bacterium]